MLLSFLTVWQAATLLGVTPRTAQRLKKSGHLKDYSCAEVRRLLLERVTPQIQEALLADLKEQGRLKRRRRR